MSNDIMVNYTNSKLYFTDNWTKEDIMYSLSFVYIGLLVGTGVIYLNTMYNQYKNAHDKWYDINDSPRKRR